MDTKAEKGKTINVNLELIRIFFIIFRKPITNAYWYLYLYAAIILMLPMIQCMAAIMEKRDYEIFFVISVIFFCVFPIITHYYPDFNICPEFQLPVYSSYICMLLLGGGYIRRFFTVSMKKIPLLVIWVICILLNIYLTYTEYLRDQSNYLFFDNRCLFLIIIESICLFIICMQFKLNPHMEQIIKTIGKSTFTIYLLSDYLINRLVREYAWACNYLPRCVCVFLWEISVFVIGFLIAQILQRTPFIKHIC